MNDSVYDPQVKRPVRIQILRYASLVLAFAGLILLYLYSINRDIPTVRISKITPTMNFATVRVVGNVSRDAYIFNSGGVVFNLHDGSGEIAILGGRAQAEALRQIGNLPRRGDRVEVIGSLSTGADQEVKLRMHSADQMTLQRKKKVRSHAPPCIMLSDITPAQKGDQLSVKGLLKEISIPPPGSRAPYVLTLEENGVELAVIFWDRVFQGLEKKLPIPGEMIRATGRVDLYKNTLQLKVWEAVDLRVVDESARPASLIDSLPCQISSITADREGTVFTVAGTLGEPRSIRGGILYPLTDDSGEILLLFWDKQVSVEDRDILGSGVRLHVTAPLLSYKGTLELVPKDSGAFHLEVNR